MTRRSQDFSPRSALALAVARKGLVGTEALTKLRRWIAPEDADTEARFPAPHRAARKYILGIGVLHAYTCSTRELDANYYPDTITPPAVVTPPEPHASRSPRPQHRHGPTAGVLLGQRILRGIRQSR
jgi:hypothetical protein